MESIVYMGLDGSAPLFRACKCIALPLSSMGIRCSAVVRCAVKGERKSIMIAIISQQSHRASELCERTQRKIEETKEEETEYSRKLFRCGLL